MPQQDFSRIQVVTPSYRWDAERCTHMCETFDRHVDPAFEHLVIVPRRDLDLFRHLDGGRRRVVVTEEMFPARLKPTSRRKERWRIGLRRWITGWELQQLVKISAARDSAADLVVLVDSDLVFLRPLTLEKFIEDRRVRLYRTSDSGAAGEVSDDASWHRRARELLGLPARPRWEGCFVTPLVAWLPDVVRDMCDRIETVAGTSWLHAAARYRRQKQLSEFTVYGLHATTAGDQTRARHILHTRSLCHVSPGRDAMDDGGLSAYLSGVEPHHVAAVIQSNLRLPTETWRRIADDLRSRVAAVSANEPQPANRAGVAGSP